MKYGGGGGSLRMKPFTLICKCAIVKCDDNKTSPRSLPNAYTIWVNS
jgi:hypothetical protein